MKPRYIILIVLIAVAIGSIISLYGSSSQYVSFPYAEEEAGKEFHIIGQLVKDSAIVYDPVKDPNHLEFYMTDTLHNVRKVIFNSPKPSDLDRSENIVLVGKMKEDGHFHASSILLKCPSKYNEGKLEETEFKATK